MKTAERFRFAVGDCVILNDVDRPRSTMVAVITSHIFHPSREVNLYDWSYLNAEPKFDGWCEKVHLGTLDRATKLEDFGVVLHQHDGRYWCQRVGESIAVYPDGLPREWQDTSVSLCVGRPELLKLIEQRPTPPAAPPEV